jgi:hypothetical protein
VTWLFEEGRRRISDLIGRSCVANEHSAAHQAQSKGLEALAISSPRMPSTLNVDDRYAVRSSDGAVRRPVA